MDGWMGRQADNLSPYVGEIIGDHQCLLRRNRSTTDYTEWFKYDRDLCGLFTHKSVPVIFESPVYICIREILDTNGSTMRQYISYS
jgi:hypothetical protein